MISSPKGGKESRNREYQAQRKKKVSLLQKNGWLAIRDIKDCHNKNGAVIKINYFSFCKACEGRTLTQTVIEMRKHLSHCPQNVIPQFIPSSDAPFFPAMSLLPALQLYSHQDPQLNYLTFSLLCCSQLVRDYTRSLPTGCWNRTRGEPITSLPSSAQGCWNPGYKLRVHSLNAYS